jgi:alpha-D-ribose 1-methylphosphonate 5-triphosphate synthase subunit PhnH
MSQPVTVLAPGLADPGRDAQRLFRAVLDAFAHPGRITSLPDPPAGPGTICPATAGYLLTLVDRDTPLWLAPELDLPAVRDFVRFHSGAPIVAKRGEATFAVLAHDTAPSLDDFAIGTDPYPDRHGPALARARDRRTGGRRGGRARRGFLAGVGG